MGRRESAALLGIEQDLRSGDHTLDVMLRRFGQGLRGRAWNIMCGVRPRTVLALAVLSLGLLAAGLCTSAVPVFWAFTGCWALTLAIAFALLRACAEGRQRGR
ncbi:hypothetical protein ACFVSN_00925 [Kitasatospora sp. NPDC057904]|uniref:hypothetical protein n=1 Tax=unclassified Kitasatospora TaxID=2633591 RepID=UPI0036D9B1E5